MGGASAWFLSLEGLGRAGYVDFLEEERRLADFLLVQPLSV